MVLIAVYTTAAIIIVLIGIHEEWMENYGSLK